MSAAKCTARTVQGSGFRIQDLGGSGLGARGSGVKKTVAGIRRLAQFAVLSTQYLFWVATLGICYATIGVSSKAAEPISFAEQLDALAAKCDELGLKEQADITRGWIIRRHPGRQYLFLPQINDPGAPKSGAPEAVRQWHKRFLEVRRQRAADLVAAAKEAAEKRQAAHSYQLLFEILHEDTDHAEARRILGYTKLGGEWRLPGAEKMAARSVSFDHSKLGWRARSYWILETPHYSIVSNHSARELLEAGQELEKLHSLWRQIFFTYWSTPEALAARFAGQDEPLAPERPKMQVVLFKNRQEYAAHVAAAHSKAASTLGLYDDQQRIAYFFAGDKSVYPTWYHEATHQLFQESLPGLRDQPGAERNFWALEGVALYMESLSQHSGYWTVGGCEADRLQFARYRVLTGDLDLPIMRISALSREQMQGSDDIGRIYTQAAGLAHFFMDGAGGANREAFVELIARIYRGEDAADAFTAAAGQPTGRLDEQYREYLQVTDDDLAGIPDPARCQNLSLCRASITDRGLARFAGTKNLRWLDLTLTTAGDEGLAHFAGNGGLKQLFLEGTKISERSLPLIAGFKQLAELDLSRLPITDEGLAGLRGLKQLEQLHVSGGSVTPQGLQRLKSALPKLKLTNTQP